MMEMAGQLPGNVGRLRVRIRAGLLPPNEMDACQQELTTLVSAVQSNPTVSNMNALIDFIEEQTGSVIEELAGDVWSDVIADGEPREARIRVCNMTVTLTIDGTLTTSGSCSSFPKYAMTLEDQDFHMDSIRIGAVDPTSAGSYSTFDVLPSYDVHLEHPRLEYIGQESESEISLIISEDGANPENLPVIVANGEFNIPTIRVNGYYTERVALSDIYSGDAESHNYTYTHRHPPVGMKLIRRAPSGTVGVLTVDAPLRLGTISGSNIVHESADFAINSASANQGDFLMHKLQTVNSSFAPWPSPSASGDTEEEAWENFVAVCDAYNASRNIYQPTLEVGDRAITVRFETRDNAFRIRTYGCNTSGGALAQKYDALGVNYGGYITIEGVNGGGPQLKCAPIPEPVGADRFLHSIQTRIITDNDDEVGYTRTNWRRVASIAAGQFIPEVEAAVAEPDPRPLFNYMEPDPDFGSPVPSPGSPDPTVPLGDPAFPVNGRATFDPDAPPLFEADWPFDEPAPIGDPFEFTPPDPDFDTPFEPPDFYPPTFNAPISDWKFKTPSFDPCNFGMPDFGGDICGPSGMGDTGMPSEGSPWGGTDNFPTDFGGTPTGGGGGDIGGVGGVGGGAGGYNPGPDGMDPDSELPGGSKYLDEERCYQDELATSIITEMAMDLGLDESKIIINPEGVACDETYTGCFPAGTNKFDILKKMASICGYGVIDTGGGIIIQPPSPNDVHHYLDNYNNIFFLERHNTDVDLYHHVEVFRPPLIRDGVVIKPAVSKVALIDTPFEPDEGSIKYIRETDYNLTDAQLQNIANLEAGKVGGLGSQVQVTTLWREGYAYALYDQLHLRRYDRGWFTDWKIRHIEHMFTDDGNLTIAQASWIGYDPAPALPAPVNTSQALRPQLANYG